MANVDIFVGGKLLSVDYGELVVKGLYAATPDLAQMEHDAVESRSPELTGALKMDITAEASVGPNPDNILAFIYSGEENQLDWWNRYYAIYQEGGALGAGSNNGSGNHQMYARIMTDDIEQIQKWGIDAINAQFTLLTGTTP